MDSPADWIRDVLKEHIWSKQEEICECVVSNRYTAVAVRPAKSFIRKDRCVVERPQLGDAFLVSPLPRPHVQRSLGEMRIPIGSVGLGRIPLDCNWYLGEVGSEELIDGRRRYDEAAFHGIHAARPVISDEAACR
jgi:hypothetical protein